MQKSLPHGICSGTPRRGRTGEYECAQCGKNWPGDEQPPLEHNSGITPSERLRQLFGDRASQSGIEEYTSARIEPAKTESPQPFDSAAWWGKFAARETARANRAEVILREINDYLSRPGPGESINSGSIIHRRVASFLEGKL